MNKEQLGIQLSNIRKERPVEHLSLYATQSIEDARSSYPVANLITYCSDLNMTIKMTDMATLDEFVVTSVFEVHDILQLMMKRYMIDEKLIYRRSGVHYTPPKDERGSLSIVTFLAMCEVLHIQLDFIQ